MMLCKSITEKELGNLKGDYQANIKYDGERIQAIIKDGKVTLLNRRGRVKNSHYSEIVEELEKYFEDCILDGEVISEDDNFNKLQRRALTTNKQKQQQLRKEIPVKYMVFDILELKGRDLRNEDLRYRYLRLYGCGCFGKMFNDSRIEIAEYGEVLNILSKAKSENREGIVIKNMKGKYEERRSHNWLKLKFFKYLNLNLNEYSVNNAGIRCLDSVGNVVQISGSQHEEVKEAIDNEGSCEVIVQYLEKTKDNRLRFPSFVGTMKAEAKEESIKMDEW